MSEYEKIFELGDVKIFASRASFNFRIRILIDKILVALRLRKNTKYPKFTLLSDNHEFGQPGMIPERPVIFEVKGES